MAQTIIIHLTNADPILAEVEDVESLDGPVLECTNPRARDGKRLHYITPEATTFLFPWHRISFIETYPTDEDRAKVETFFRE